MSVEAEIPPWGTEPELSAMEAMMWRAALPADAPAELSPAALGVRERLMAAMEAGFDEVVELGAR